MKFEISVTKVRKEKAFSCYVLRAEFFPELVVVSTLKFLHHVKYFADQLLFDDFEKLVLLEILTRNVERQVIGVDDTTDEGQV